MLPLPIMKTRCSMPAVRPLCARLASPPSALALVIAWRSEPGPASLVLTTVAKLKPKSTPLTLAAPVATALNDCAVPDSSAPNTPVEVLKLAPLLPAPGSTSAGFVPPTWSVTATAAPLLAFVR